MSAFGRRNGPGTMLAGSRPQFGVARPMKGIEVPRPQGGEQFPPLPAQDPAPLAGSNGEAPMSDAMARLQERVNGVVEGNYQAEGFEASVHRIKEQVLPRLLERVDPKRRQP